MSLPPSPIQRSLFDVENLIGREFQPTDRFRLFHEKVFPSLLAARRALAGCYCADNGRPAEEPVMLLGATVLQFMERVPDRTAAECVCYHLGWKLALGLDLSPQSFHPTTLCVFRQRLLGHEKAKLAFDAVLSGLIDAGLVARRSRQRLDSTHVLGLVAKMSSLDVVRETMRLALMELSRRLAEIPECDRPVLPQSWPLLWERYVESKLDYQADESSLKQKLAQAGTDVRQLLQWVDGFAQSPGKKNEAQEKAEPDLGAGKQVLLLRRVFEENFEVAPPATSPATSGESNGDTDGPAGKAPVVAPRHARPAGAVQNPHDPEAQWCCKSRKPKAAAPSAGSEQAAGESSKGKKMEWVGYKTQVAETVQEQPRQPGEPTASFLTSIETQLATGSDLAGMEQTLRSQQESGLQPPPEMNVDSSYISAQSLREAAEQGRELVGPALPPGGDKAIRSDAFDVDILNRQAVCPAGHASTNCSRLEGKTTTTYRFEWGGQSGPCGACPLRQQCLGAGQTHRTLAVGEDHFHLQQRRREMRTDAFKEKTKSRNAIEGTISELARGHGMRQTRCRGLSKVRMRNYLIGAACNAKRWVRRVAWEMKQTAAGVTRKLLDAKDVTPTSLATATGV